MSRQDSSSSSRLRSGQTPQSYGAFPSNHNIPSNGSTENPPPPYAHSFAVPGPTPVRPPGSSHIQPPVPIPHLTEVTSQERTRMVISRGLTICLAVILLQSVLIICRSDVLARYIDLDSVAHRASREKSALMVEREKSEQERMKWECEREEWETERGKWGLERGRWERERGEWKSEREKSEREEEKLRLERERWERAREDRVPQGAFWEVVWPNWDCRAYGKREYWGVLRNIPEGWTAMDACTNMPVEIRGVAIRRPNRCGFAEGSPHIHGYWMVDWDQPDCKPWHTNYQDAGCTSYGSGHRRIEAQLVGMNTRGGQDWWLLCSTTPLIWNQIMYTSPTHCEDRGEERKIAMWDVPDESCL